MASDKCLVFDVWARFGYFRRYFSTTTATTHTLIPRSVAEGLIAAIVGLSSEEYPERMWKSHIAVGLTSKHFASRVTTAVSRIEKLPMSVTYTHSDFWRSVPKYLRQGGGDLNYVRAPRRVVFLMDPAFRIYFATEDEDLYTKFANRMKNHTTYFTPFLGSSNMIANFAFIGEYEFQNHTTSDDYVGIASVIPFFGRRLPRPRIEKGLRFAIEENIPLHVSAERKAAGFYSALYTTEPDRLISVKDIRYTILQSVNGSVNIVFIPETVSAA